jgi:putative tryptophan/tyrosine transport system substrate-binding protein
MLFSWSGRVFAVRRTQFSTLAARDRILAAYSVREFVVAGGLMSYGSDLTSRYRQVGVYTGGILKDAKPADLPVVEWRRPQSMPSRREPAGSRAGVPPVEMASADI